jgi:hypothetical protein
MRPIDLLGVPWNALDSNRMLQFFHRQSRDELNARDVARGLPKSLACGRWQSAGNDATFVVDPVLSRLKHSGEQHQALRAKMWAQFCSEPRDPAVELAKIGYSPSPDETPRARLTGLNATIEAAIAAGIEAGLKAAGLSADKSKTPKVTG